MDLGAQLAHVQTASEPHFTVEALASVLDPELIREELELSGKASQRIRALPAQLVVWLVVAMGLYRSLSIQNVLYQLVQGLGIAVRWKESKAPGSGAVAKARRRLGWEVIRSLFRKLAELLGARYAEAHLWKGLVLLSLDGTTFMTQDSPENDSWFGRPKANRGKTAFPKVRLVALMGVWSHLLLGAVFAPYGTSELTTAKYLLARIKPGSLVLMDRLYYSFEWLTGFPEGSQFLVRAKTGKRVLRPKRRKKLGNWDWLAVLPRPKHLRSEGLPQVLKVRVLKYQRKGFKPVTLVTTLLDPVAYPADELRALYHARWEIELGYDEIKSHFARERVVFRSLNPWGVLQEAYGLLLAYNCVRALMAEAAERSGVEPRRLSFVDCLVRIRFALTKMALAPTRRLPVLYEELLTDLATCVLPPRRSERIYPRAVKIKMSSFPLKRSLKGRGRRPRRKGT